MSNPNTVIGSNPITIQIGQRLRGLRMAKGLSQSDLAKKVSLSFQQIQKYESGQSQISASKLHEIALALDTSIIWFFNDLPMMSDDVKALEPQDIFQKDAWKVASEFNTIKDKVTREKILDLVKYLATL